MSPTDRTAPRILISRLSAHGDVIQTLPLLAALREQFPGGHIGWLVEESAAPLLANHPLIDRLHVSRRKRWLRTLRHAPWQLPAILAEASRLLRELGDERYEVSLDVQGLFKSAVLPFLAGIPRRMGYARTREQAAFFYTETLPYHDLKKPDYPTVLKFMEFVQALETSGQPVQAFPPKALHGVRFPLPPVTPESRERIDRLLHSLPPDLPLLAVAPGTVWPSKHWPEEHWQSLFAGLAQEPVNVVLIGAPTDRTAFERWLADVPEPRRFLNLAGETEFSDLYALFPRCNWFLGLDSAPLHAANAVARNNPQEKPRILGIYGPTAPGRTGPVGEEHKTLQTELICQPCFERRCPLKTTECMGTLSPAQVMAALKAMMHAEVRTS